MSVMLLLCLLGAGATESIDVAPVWSGHPVGFALLTHHDRQFVAYYDAERRMTVAARRLDDTSWHTVVLPERLNWDSHNYVTMAIDDQQRLHLSGNMHGAPLTYFRTREPLNIDTLERAPMVGSREDRVTYPTFFRGPNKAFIFTYRDGKSGNGEQIYNVYDGPSETWRRLLDSPLTSGQGRMNAYLNGPILGPDGRYHLSWVWRDNPGCESNHDPSYARSADLIHWETAGGEPLTLPLTIDNVRAVDPVPPGGGVINGNVKLGFDGLGRPIVSYHKFDDQGLTQAFNARFEDGAWKVYQTSDWDYRWDFRGGGSIPFDIRISSVTPAGEGRLKQSYTHIKHGAGLWLLDEATLKPVETTTRPVDAPAPTPEGPPTLQPRRAGDAGAGDEPGVSYQLQWETLPSNRDRPREGEPPPPSMLRVVKSTKAAASG